jgi:hypothetical protein
VSLFLWLLAQLVFSFDGDLIGLEAMVGRECLLELFFPVLQVMAEWVLFLPRFRRVGRMMVLNC